MEILVTQKTPESQVTDSLQPSAFLFPFFFLSLSYICFSFVFGMTRRRDGVRT